MTPQIEKDWHLAIDTLMKHRFKTGIEHTRKTQAISLLEDAVSDLITSRRVSEHEAQAEIAEAFKSPATLNAAIRKYTKYSS